MLNLETRKITQTRDVRWTQKMYHEHMSTSKDNELASSEDELDDEENNEKKKKKIEEKIEEKQIRLERALKKLDTFYNPVLMNLTLDEDFCFVGGTDDNHENPGRISRIFANNFRQKRLCDSG